MLNLKVKHKLLAIWLGSITLALALMAGLFQYQIQGLHEQNARNAIANAITTLHNELEAIAIHINSDVRALASRSDIVATLNLIDRYQDPANYQGDIFDGEKQKLMRELSQLAIATDTDVLAALDTKGLIAAFYISPAAGGRGGGYVVFDNGEERVIYADKTDASHEDVPSLIAQLMPMYGPQKALSFTERKQLALSATAEIKRQTVGGTQRVVGTAIAAKVISADFQTRMQQSSAMAFGIIPPNGDIATPLPGLTPQILAGGAAPLTLDSVLNHPEGVDFTWLPNSISFAGAASMDIQDGRKVTFVFAQRKDDLQGTLATFQQSILLVLIFSTLLVVPVGIFFMNRTITKPVEDLVTCAEQLGQGQSHDISTFRGKDEFSELARAFQHMSDAVRARESALKDAQRIAKLASWEWNAQTGKMTYSDETYSILAHTPVQLGDDLSGLLACLQKEDAIILKRRLTETQNTSLPFSTECSVTLPDGRKRVMTFSGEARSENDGNGMGRITGVGGAMQDTTERHLLEQAKSELIATVSHELRTPLTSVIGTLGLALGGVTGELPDKLRGMLATADKNAKRLGTLIDELLDIEKITGGSLTFDFRPISVAAIVRKAQESNQAYAMNLDVNIRIQGNIPDAQVFGDEHRLVQLLTNLLSNACKFSNPDTTVFIHCENREGRVAISVTDVGPGIPADFEPYVFERFAQADQSLTRQNQRGGTGLGLAIALAIAERHDGHLTFVTRREPDPAHGTTFTLTLPQWHSSE